MLAAIIVLALLGKISDGLLAALEKRCLDKPGRAAGKRMRRTRRVRLKPYICPTSTSLRSISRIAATPLRYTGKNAPMAISTIFEVSSMPSHSSNSGTQARLGIERRPACGVNVDQVIDQLIDPSFGQALPRP